MCNPVKERASFGARHDFDSLPTDTDIEVRFAQYSELCFLADMARRMVPGVQLTASSLGRYFTFDPECILTFSRRGKLLGGVALLYFNSRGHDALILDEISLAQPDLGLLAGRDDEVSATYIWAIATTGRGIAGYGKVAAHLRTPRYVHADCFAQPSTKAGRELLVSTCFEQIPSFQPDLWRYERPWNRHPSNMPTPIVSTGSFAHARH
jgi:hypothetical protein